MYGKEYLKSKEYPPMKAVPKSEVLRCPATFIETRMKAITPIVLEGISHAGTIAHICSMQAGHPIEEDKEVAICKCYCGYTWVRQF